ncbi:organic hydroperoxide resistance protein [Arthrobacter sp. UM1]|uniref:organic hydroperoxide resistance protein n=1 Tax=Arthrobacter sp. UM1 TaxID=2766776 RepID=UPI001CF65828|nr:organic hydroperoxide resistance protein [Arthrobacter sp. UM1]MCB4208178.1 organic hydroperoxide resistance protein [Arthrobacter sp. UM1]
MSDVLYSIDALSTGDARNGHVRTSDGALDLDLAAPSSMGGSGNGFNPEQLFAAGYAACFHGALKAVAREKKSSVEDSSVESKVDFLKDASDGGFRLAVTLTVRIPGMEEEAAQELADAAHAMCPYSKATRGNIDVTVTVADA